MVESDHVVVVSAIRTAIGRFRGTLRQVPATALGAVVVGEAVQRARLNPARVDEVLMGQVVQAGAGQAPARQVALGAGLPHTVGATTFNKVCGSGLKTVMMASAMLRGGDADIIVAGGMESMNRAPHALRGARAGYRLGDGQLVDLLIHDGLWCSFEDQHMGMAAERIAQTNDVSRDAQDAYSLQSHRRAQWAIKNVFADEIAPVDVPNSTGGTISFCRDECPRADTSLAGLANLRGAFVDGGSVTAGNASAIADGAAAVVVMRRGLARELGCEPLARLVGYAQAAVAPAEIFAAPVHAVRKVLRKTGVSLADIDLVELNEAFAAQVLVNGRELGLDWERVNVYGGAIALGHPIGASGARILVTLIHALRRRAGRYGLATACLGGGEAVAMLIQAE